MLPTYRRPMHMRNNRSDPENEHMFGFVRVFCVRYFRYATFSRCDRFALRPFRIATYSLCVTWLCVRVRVCAFALHYGTLTLALRVCVRFITKRAARPCEHGLCKGYAAPYAALSPHNSTLPDALDQCDRVPSSTHPPSRRHSSKTTCR